MTVTVLLRNAANRALVQAAYAAGYAAPADEDRAAEALTRFCERFGYKPGDPFAEAWVLGWNEARRAKAEIAR